MLSGKNSIIFVSLLLLLTVFSVTTKADDDDESRSAIIEASSTTPEPKIETEVQTTVEPKSESTAKPTASGKSSEGSSSTKSPVLEVKTVSIQHDKQTVATTTEPPKTNQLSTSKSPELKLTAIHSTPTSATPIAHESSKVIVESGDAGKSKVTVANASIISIKHEDSSHANETTHKFCEYLKPICDSIDAIKPKQLLRLQGQFKQIVNLTQGKLAMCFTDNFLFNPSVQPVTKNELQTLCLSKNIPPTIKGSYKLFQDCASLKWDPAVDKELDRIIKLRLNCINNHQHPERNDSLLHEDDEMSLINDVVSKVFEGNKGLANNPEIKVIDVTGKDAKKVPLVNVSNAQTNSLAKEASSALIIKGSHGLDGLAHSASVANNDRIMNDPNTVVVLVDDRKSTTTTKPVSSVALVSPLTSVKVEMTLNNTSSTTTTVKPSSIAGQQPSASRKGSLAEKIITSVIGGDPKKVDGPSTASIGTNATSTTATPSTNLIESTVSIGSTSTTTTSRPKSTALVSTVASTSTKAPEKPSESWDEAMRRMEKEKVEFESKMKSERERIMKKLRMKQDESEAQKAIKSLQLQRQATVHSPNLHQLEHDRQMAFDPIGHTIKHQQYEMAKQQRMMISG